MIFKYDFAKIQFIFEIIKLQKIMPFLRDKRNNNRYVVPSKDDGAKIILMFPPP